MRFYQSDRVRIPKVDVIQGIDHKEEIVNQLRQSVISIIEMDNVSFVNDEIITEKDDHLWREYGCKFVVLSLEEYGEMQAKLNER